MKHESVVHKIVDLVDETHRKHLHGAMRDMGDTLDAFGVDVRDGIVAFVLASASASQKADPSIPMKSWLALCHVVFARARAIIAYGINGGDINGDNAEIAASDFTTKKILQTFPTICLPVAVVTFLAHTYPNMTIMDSYVCSLALGAYAAARHRLPESDFIALCKRIYEIEESADELPRAAQPN